MKTCFKRVCLSDRFLRTGICAILIFTGTVLNVSAAPAKESVNTAVDKVADPLIAEAVKNMRNGKYDEAIKNCDTASQKLKKMNLNQKDSVYLNAKINMINGLMSEIHQRQGKTYMGYARAAYEEAMRVVQVDKNKAKSSFQKTIYYANAAAKNDPSLDASAMKLKASVNAALKSDLLFGADKLALKEIRKRRMEVDTKINPYLSKSIDMLKKEQFAQAFENNKQAERALNECNYSKESVVYQEKLSYILEVKHDILNKWFKKCIYDAKKACIEAYSYAGKEEDRAMEKIRQASQIISKAESIFENKMEVANYAELEKVKQSCNDLTKNIKNNKLVTLDNIDPANEENKDRIAYLLRRGDVFYKNRLYDKARDSYEQVLITDPYNQRAAYSLNKVYSKLRSIASLRLENEILERINENEWKWNNSILPKMDQNVETRPEVADSLNSNKIYQKMKEIKIPLVSFKESQIGSAVTRLRDLCKQYDPEKKGVNIQLLIPDNEEKNVTMTFENMPFGEIIRYLCLATNLKYRVDNNSITIAKNVDTMDRRSYKMTPSLFSHIAKEAAGGGGGLGDEDGKGGKGKEKKGKYDMENAVAKTEDVFKSDSSSENETEEVLAASDADLKGYFKRMGILFAPGSSITYDEHTNILSMVNTPENHTRLETILPMIDIPNPLVLIESKILEISVTDLEELGFDWTLEHNNENPKYMYGFASKDTTEKAVAFGTNYITQTLVRHYGGNENNFNSILSTENPTALINNLNILPNFGPDGGNNVFLTVNAIDQSQRGELLSAPKIIALSGSTASIELSRQMYFPESWDDPEVNVTNNTYEYTPPVPDFGDAVPVGVTFTVKPDVSQNQKTIQLKLNPMILDLVGWTDYDYEIVIGPMNTPTNTYYPKIKMPETAIREIDTNVKVYDGETLVLGGILEEKTSQRDDKYPFFGDVPLVGRLFASQAKNSDKTNLLIFVTARIIKQNGKPAIEKDDAGLFDFER